MKLSTRVILILLVTASAFAQTPAPPPGQPPPQATSGMYRQADVPVAPVGEPPRSPTTLSGLLGITIGAVLLMVMLAALAFSDERHPPRHA